MQHPPTPRRHDLDWVRIGAFALLILYHSGMYYVSWDWHVKSPFASHTIEPLMMLSSPWRLALLFFVSGCATAFLMGRQPAGFVAARARRLLLPLLFGMIVIVTPQAYFEVVEKLGYADGYFAFWARYLAGDGSFCRGTDCLRVPTWNHLWFVAYLFVYSVLLWVMVWALVKWAPGRMAALADGLARHCAGIGVLLWPVLLLAAVRLALVARFPTTHALVDDWHSHAVYFSVFVLGFAVARQDMIWEALRRRRWLALGLAAASYAFITWYFNVYAPSVTGDVPQAMRWLQRVVYATNQWMAIVAVLGFARHWAPGDSPARRYFTEAVFPFYIVHQTAIVVIAHQLKPVGLAPAVEAPLLIAATVATCFASFELLRRVGWLRPWFGLSAAAPRLIASRDDLRNPLRAHQPE